jgi:hypothetical protein
MVALEQLLGGECHHMEKVFGHIDEAPVWQAASEGTMPDWESFLSGYVATCDWPSAAFWPELSAAFPDAPVILSLRDPEAWFRSVQNTIAIPLEDSFKKPRGEDPWADMVTALMTNRFIGEWGDHDAMIAAFNANNERVKAEIDPKRLVIWQASDGWEPLCAALDMPVPSDPFPVTNTTAQFREMLGAPPV